MRTANVGNFFEIVTATLFLLSSQCLAQDKGFDDSILFNINWPGESSDLLLENKELERLVVTTSHQEKYQCILPNIQEKEKKTTDVYDGPTPLELLAPIFAQHSCSFRLESYWTYEVCHGQYIRQYHEDREGKKVKLQEYILGKWDKDAYNELLTELKGAGKENSNTPVPTKKIDTLTLPYFEVTMGNGTLCDLNQNKPRETKVVYVCYIHGKHEIFSLKETSTCQYEIIVLSPLLCAHPKYKPQETGENEINCLPLDGSPNKPHNLLKLKAESLKLRRKEMEHIRVEFVPLGLNDKDETSTKVPETPIDTSPVENFLTGVNCLNGGTGWWKYEFCYGKSVEQYHVNKDGTKTSINLGYFKKSKHLEWIETHPHKRPKALAQRTQLSHLYSGGSICDKTGQPRQTEVKLKCSENTNINAVSLYLLEPKYCEYILGVESPLICDILSRADENGLIKGYGDDEESVSEEETPAVNVIVA